MMRRRVMRRRPRMFRRRQRNLLWLPAVGPGQCWEDLTVTDCQDPILPDLFLLAAAQRGLVEGPNIESVDEGTLLRMVGNLSCDIAASNPAGSPTQFEIAVCVGIYITDLTTGAPPPVPGQVMSVADPDQEPSKDWLWRGMWGTGAALGTGGSFHRNSNEDQYWKDLDIRVKRKITPNEALILTWDVQLDLGTFGAPAGGVQAKWNGDLRALIKMG